jgi:hypothetical protein
MRPLHLARSGLHHKFHFTGSIQSNLQRPTLHRRSRQHVDRVFLRRETSVPRRREFALEQLQLVDGTREVADGRIGGWCRESECEGHADQQNESFHCASSPDARDVNQAMGML